MSKLLREPTLKTTTAIGSATAGLSAVDAVRVVVNTAVAMMEHEPVINVRSIEHPEYGLGVLIWIPGYISNGDTIIVASAGREGAAVVATAAPTPPQEQPT